MLMCREWVKLEIHTQLGWAKHERIKHLCKNKITIYHDHVLECKMKHHLNSRCNPKYLEHGTPANISDPGESLRVSFRANMNPPHSKMLLSSPRPRMSYHCLSKITSLVSWMDLDMWDQLYPQHHDCRTHAPAGNVPKQGPGRFQSVITWEVSWQVILYVYPEMYIDIHRYKYNNKQTVFFIFQALSQYRRLVGSQDGWWCV